MRLSELQLDFGVLSICNGGEGVQLRRDANWWVNIIPTLTLNVRDLGNFQHD